MELRELIDEANHMHELNLELIQELELACKWILENKIRPPNRKNLVSILNKIDVLLHEIYSTPKMQYIKEIEPTDEFLHRKRTDEDFTESG